VVGEPIVALDLIDTAAPGSPVAEDLLSAERDALGANRDRLRTEIQWHRDYGGNPRLAFIAARAAQLLPDPSNVNPRRSWCAPAVCGNRTRVARHYRRAGRA
jgi:CGNR zinc finger